MVLMNCRQLSSRRISPVWALPLKVDLAVKYVVTEKATNKVVYDSRVISSYKARFGEAFAGTTRVRKANEGAVRENIKKFIEELAAVQFS